MDNINQPFKPEPIEGQKERFKKCLEKPLCPYHSSPEYMQVFDIEAGFRVFVGVFMYPDEAPLKQLHVIARRMEGEASGTWNDFTNKGWKLWGQPVELRGELVQTLIQDYS